MTTDFRALCAELVDDLELCDWPYKLSETIRADINRARAALAEPQPEEPTDEELYDYWISTSPEFGCADPIGFARAVLARWGRPVPQHNPWKETLLNALVCNFLLNAENEDDPRKALSDLIAWEKQLATDPLINPPSLPDTND